MAKTGGSWSVRLQGPSRETRNSGIGCVRLTKDNARVGIVVPKRFMLACRSMPPARTHHVEDLIFAEFPVGVRRCYGVPDDSGRRGRSNVAAARTDPARIAMMNPSMAAFFVVRSCVCLHEDPTSSLVPSAHFYKGRIRLCDSEWDGLNRTT